MVFHCRCLPIASEKDEDTEIRTSALNTVRYNSTKIDALVAQTKSTSDGTFYTASSVSTGPVSSNLANNPDKLRVFTVAELKVATNNFSRDLKIGQDTSGSIYRGVIKSLEPPFHDIQVTVKNGARQRLNAWVTTMNFLEVVEHPNIVKLLGYCAKYGEVGTQRFLVYEYMPNKSVRDHLSTRYEPCLPWIMRLKVAQHVACALAYLHKEKQLQNIDADLKSSCVLLDDQCNAKLSNIALVRLGPQGRLARACHNYQARYEDTWDHLASKSGVWSYGVLLCELLTGRCPLDKTRLENEQNLIEWVKPYLESKKFQQIVDSRLEHKYLLESVRMLATVANMCLSDNHESRPLTGGILEMVSQIIPVALHESEVPEMVSQIIPVALQENEVPEMVSQIIPVALHETNPETQTLPLKRAPVRGGLAIKLKKLCMCATNL